MLSNVLMVLSHAEFRGPFTMAILKLLVEDGRHIEANRCLVVRLTKDLRESSSYPSSVPVES